MGLREEIRKLFDLPGREHWCRDGFFCEESWNAAFPRVAFLLKEPNDEARSVVECEGGKRRPIEWGGWIEIGRWAYAIVRTATSGNVPDFDECDSPVHVNEAGGPVAAWKIARHGSAVMNVKKTPGGSSVEDVETLASWARTNATALKDQLALLNPQVVVLCGQGVKGIADEVFGLSAPRTPRPYFVAQGRLWIDFHHNKARYPARLTFYGLAGIVQAALKRQEARDVLKETAK